ncbi:SGNH/GDSL hydrolase family protein [Priestia abyssalis]|uniref:SGNH/GDSL hydrolase family protein n=1 Tax=Priestia abyssalis TaxID=1221450 RepID=UPI000994F847|nr:SGNH/GDSL hydrolase family protein [Priestia abyssalis]
MKLAINVIAFMICAIVLVMGQQHWKEKLSAHANNEEADETAQMGEEKQEKDIGMYTKGLPSFLAETIHQAADTKKPIRFVVVESGSEAPAEVSWADKLGQNLENTYGKEMFHVQIQSYPGQTTADLDAGKVTEKLSALQPDIILLEAPMIYDNGLVGIYNTFSHLTNIIEQLKKEHPKLILMLQPPNPIYGAEVYPREVAELKNFAQEKGIYYIDHWQAWPAVNSPDLLKYLKEDRRFPNEKGHELWAKTIARTFIHLP